MSSSNDSAPASAHQPRSRAQFWVLVAVFFAPLAIAFALYYGLDGWRPAGSTNRGELIQPPRQIPEVALTSIDGATLPENTLRGKWTLVYIGEGDCDDTCRAQLTLIRQSRLALNDDMDRVQRLFLVTEPCCAVDYLSSEHPGLIVARLDDSAADVLRAFEAAVSEPLASAGRIYIVDPLGNLMMTYKPDAPSKALLEDMKKLLKYSHIG